MRARTSSFVAAVSSQATTTLPSFKVTTSLNFWSPVVVVSTRNSLAGLLVVGLEALGADRSSADVVAGRAPVGPGDDVSPTRQRRHRREVLSAGHGRVDQEVAVDRRAVGMEMACADRSVLSVGSYRQLLDLLQVDDRLDRPVDREGHAADRDRMIPTGPDRAQGRSARKLNTASLKTRSPTASM